MKVKDLIKLLEPYKENYIGIWDDGELLNITGIEIYHDKSLGISGTYCDRLDYDGLTIENIYEKNYD